MSPIALYKWEYLNPHSTKKSSPGGTRSDQGTGPFFAASHLIIFQQQCLYVPSVNYFVNSFHHL